MRLTDSGADGGSQFLMLFVLLGFATLSTVLVLWRLHPELRRPGGVLALVLVPGLTCAVAAAVASPLAAVLAAPPDDVPVGEVVAQSPSAGALFFGRMIYGMSGPEWEAFPPGTGWLVFGAMIAAFTVASLAHFSHSPDLRGEQEMDEQEPATTHHVTESPES